jgi:uncharacterized protein
MRIIILSDTHMPRMAKAIPKPLAEELQKADYILHIGDWQTLEVYETLKKYAPIEGVAGNVDAPDVVEKFGYKKIVELDGVRIGMTHGHGKGTTTEKRAQLAFAEEKVDIILFGHSHIPVKKEINGVIFFNPGSATDKRRQSHFSFGILQVHDGRFQIDHIYYESKS